MMLDQAYSADEPQDLSDLLASIANLQSELGYKRLSDLTIFCDLWVHPSQLDALGLEQLEERLVIQWAECSPLAGETLFDAVERLEAYRIRRMA